MVFPIGLVKRSCIRSSLILKGLNNSIWSIKVFNSNTLIFEPPEEGCLNNPTIQAKDVSDVKAEFVADPFLVTDNSKYYIFYEILDKKSGRGVIGLSTSDNGIDWNYEKVVLSEKFHLSYPQVLKGNNNDFYMIPETSEANEVILYKAINFPYEWKREVSIINGKYIDPTVFQFNDKWWMFAGSHGGKDLHLFYSESLEGSWIEHPSSPIINNNMHISRPGGRVIVDEQSNIFRYTQDGYPYYGKLTRIFKIKTLTINEYQEEEVKIVLQGTDKEADWRKDGMHHIDQLKVNGDQWIIAVDGHKFEKRNYFSWKLERLLLKIF